LNNIIQLFIRTSLRSPSKKRFEDPVPPSGRGLPGPGAYNPYD